MVDLGLGDGVFDLRTIGRIGAELARGRLGRAD
jgi:hypothetical protein